VHFASHVRRSRVIRLKLIFTFLYATSSIQNASEQFVSSVHHSILMHPHTTSVSSDHTTRLKKVIILETVKYGNTQSDCTCMLPRIDGHQLPRYTASYIRRTTSSATPLRKYQNLRVFTSTKGIQKGKFLRKIFRHLSESAPGSTNY